MDIATFYTAISHSFSLSEDEQRGIRALSEEFPYFQVAQIMYLQNTFGDDKYERLLYKFGIHIPDSRHYYKNLMLNKMYEQEVKKTPKEEVTFVQKTENTKVVEGETQKNDKQEELQYVPSFYRIGEQETPPQVEQETHNFTDWFMALEVPEKMSNVKKTAITISSFIKEEQKSKVKIAKLEIEKKETRTVLPKEQLMSQTLAEIYVKQQLYDRAIAIYEKLDLNSSEKNTTFARRIKEINELKKN